MSAKRLLRFATRLDELARLSAAIEELGEAEDWPLGPRLSNQSRSRGIGRQYRNHGTAATQTTRSRSHSPQRQTP